MRVAISVRVSTQRQAQTQTIEQQLDRLRVSIEEHGWTLLDHHIFRDDGYSGASLRRPGLDRLRDVVAAGEVDRVILTAPDRLARNYVHQGGDWRKGKYWCDTRSLRVSRAEERLLSGKCPMPVPTSPCVAGNGGV